MTQMTALIFDCDGVLADTERYGHLPAFNQTFAEFGLPVRWSEEEYGEKLRIGRRRDDRCSRLGTEHGGEDGVDQLLEEKHRFLAHEEAQHAHAYRCEHPAR